ncbi:DgyrCDS5350 [Dimorphilus gyrociliatus]|uniref:DgyrCDS5350 n=1 Tax=Dimorphilus gyrociliatus TaxID=2664684 RepID=A0A7I8VJL2_9ANNE|nr:DgyrCDS5350 [Dimorphilus gyrociliatus]
MFEKKVEKTNELIIKQGDYGDYMYVVEEGKFEALLLKNEKGKNGKAEYVRTVPPKVYDNEGFFGELALMYNTVRAACIISRSPGKLWVLDRQTFRRTIIKSTHEKLKQYEEFLQKVPLFNELTNYERNNIAYALQTIEFKDKDIILKQGEPGDSMYFVEKGLVKCTIKDKIEGEKEVSKIGPGGYFGELALLSEKPRAASVYATGDTKVAKLSRKDFDRLLGNCQDILKRNAEAYEKQLRKVFGSSKDIESIL